MQLDVNNPTAPLQLPGLFGYSYNDDGHLKEQTISYSAATAVTADFTYTSAGRPYTRTETGAGVNNESLQTSWTYNPLGELVSTTYPKNHRSKTIPMMPRAIYGPLTERPTTTSGGLG